MHFSKRNGAAWNCLHSLPVSGVHVDDVENGYQLMFFNSLWQCVE
jgi:biotin operon repressor